MAATTQHMRCVFAISAVVATLGGLVAVRPCHPAATAVDLDVCIWDVPDPGASNENHPDVVYSELKNR